MYWIDIEPFSDGGICYAVSSIGGSGLHEDISVCLFITPKTVSLLVLKCAEVLDIIARTEVSLIDSRKLFKESKETADELAWHVAN